LQAFIAHRDSVTETRGQRLTNTGVGFAAVVIQVEQFTRFSSIY
jgi:hypothetical protein